MKNLKMSSASAMNESPMRAERNFSSAFSCLGLNLKGLPESVKISDLLKFEGVLKDA